MARCGFAGDNSRQGNKFRRHHSSGWRKSRRNTTLKTVAYDRAYINTFKMQCDEAGVELPLAEFGQGYI